jgi:hypothetical protein
MAILLRNKLTNSDQYRVSDIALTSVTYDSSSNQTTINVLNSDTNHDAINIGDYIIPMRGSTSASPNFHSFDILDPKENLKIVDKQTQTGLRTLKVFGDHRKSFPGNGSPSAIGNTLSTLKHGSPNGYYSSAGIYVSQIKRNRKYRIVDVGYTNWAAFGNLYAANGVAQQGKQSATVGTTFVAKASGSGEGESGADSPQFQASFYSGGIGTSKDSPYYVSGLDTVGTLDVNGTYDRITKNFFRHTVNDLVIQLRGLSDSGAGGPGAPRWTIWNPETGKIYFEDADENSTNTNKRFDSPALGSIFRPSIGSGTNNGNTPSITWIDRNVSVSADDQYSTGIDTDAGKVIEVCHVSTAFGTNKPLTNNDIDTNFITLENNKLAADGSQPISGNLKVKGSTTIEKDINVTSQIKVGGATAYSSNTGLTLGTKDLEVNNIRLTGIINDDALFRKYGVTSFPHSFLGDYNTKNAGIEPFAILYFSSVDAFTTGSNIIAKGNNKQGKVRRVNTEYGYIMVSNVDSTNNWEVGDEINGIPSAGKIVKALNPTDYILKNQPVRVFGMNQRDTPLQASFSLSSLALAQRPTKQSAPGSTGRFTKPTTLSYQYKVAQMHKHTGKISELSDASVAIFGPSLSDWDKNNYIQLTGISRDSTDHRVLVFRKKQGETYFFLTNIYDNKDLGSSTSAITINDYGTYDKATWGILDDDPDNRNYHYLESDGMTYVPTTDDLSTNAAGRANTSTKSFVGFVGNFRKYASGFMDTTVNSTGIQTNTKNSPQFFRVDEMTFNDSPNILLRWPNVASGTTDRYNSPLHQHSTATAYGKENEIEFFIDNGRHVDSPLSGITGGIQKLILDAVANGKRTVKLPGGVYYSRLVTIPNNFKFSGQSDRNTSIKLLPWLNEDENTRTPFGGFTNDNNNHDDLGTGGARRTKQFIKYFDEFTTGDIGNGVSTGASVSRFTNLTANNAQLDSTKGIFAGVYAGRKSYARVSLELDGKTNVELADIAFDGNKLNNVAVEEDVSGKSNFTLSSQKTKNSTFKNVTVKDSVLAGIYGEEMNEIVIEGATIKNGGTFLDDSTFATGLYAPGSSKLRLTSNLIENFSNANDLTSNNNSTITGNIVKDTGSGILAYATSNFIHHGNLILGPSNEFIPVVDTLNSEYDQININLINESGSSSSTFTSDIITFLRDDSPMNLAPINTSTNDVGVALTSSIRTLVQSGTQSYFLPDTIENKNFNYTFGNPADSSGYAITVPLPNSHPTDPNLTDGNVQLKITGSSSGGKLNDLFTYGSFGTLLTKYESLATRSVNESLVGLVYDVIGTEYLYLRENDTAINWTYIKIDKNPGSEELTLKIDSNYAGLFAIGDRIIFESIGIPSAKIGNAPSIGLATRTARDMNGNPIYVGLPIKSKTVGSSRTTLVCDISNNAIGTEGSAIRNTINNVDVELETGLNPPVADLSGAKVGIENRFSIAKGRIIV